MELVVECSSGHRGVSTPGRFMLGPESFEVVQVMDQWLGEESRYFKVLVADGSVYILRQNREFSYWELTFFCNSTTLERGKDLALRQTT